MKRAHRLVASCAALGLAAGAIAVSGGAAQASNKCKQINSVQKFLQCVSAEDALEHMDALQAIADTNGDTRASGTPGYDASVDYVVERMEAAGYDVTVTPFDFFAFTDLGGSVMQQVTPNAVTYVEETDFIATPHSVPGEVTAPVTPVDLALGLGNASTSGCEPEDFVGFPTGNIALLQRGFCTFEIKAENAAAAGASAVLFFNQGNTDAPARNGIPAVTLGNFYTGNIPALSTTYAIGVQLSQLSGLTMHLKANVTRVGSVTYNVVADSPWGDPANVVMAGAHLDSVPEGPGINDNGSGTAALIEVAEELAHVKASMPNKVRFAWWGAEEGGLVGSTVYVNDLVANAPDELDAIAVYLNFDMVASPNYGLFVYDGDGSGFGIAGPPGSAAVEALFEDFYADRGLPSEPTAFDGRSDYQAFIANGVAAGGLFTGAEVPKTAAQVAKWGGTEVAFDPCYHSECDTIDNVSVEALDINSDAIATAVYTLAQSTAILG
jgi:Zn-dependent M28 family amino/carboxypeptidase